MKLINENGVRKSKDELLIIRRTLEADVGSLDSWFTRFNHTYDPEKLSDRGKMPTYDRQFNRYNELKEQIRTIDYHLQKR